MRRNLILRDKPDLKNVDQFSHLAPTTSFKKRSPLPVTTDFGPSYSCLCFIHGELDEYVGVRLSEGQQDFKMIYGEAKT